MCTASPITDSRTFVQRTPRASFSTQRLCVRDFVNREHHTSDDRHSQAHVQSDTRKSTSRDAEDVLNDLLEEGIDNVYLRFDFTWMTASVANIELHP